VARKGVPEPRAKSSRFQWVLVGLELGSLSDSPCVAVAPVWLAGTKVVVVIDPQRIRGRSHGKDFKVLGDVDKLPEGMVVAFT